MNRIAATLVSVGLFVGTFACASEDANLNNVENEESELRTSAGGGATGNGRKCYWDPADTASGYSPGQAVPAPDSCNRCVCTPAGIRCTKRACPAPVCKYGGKTFNVGQQYPDTDCCNVCTCQADGTSACGGRLCGPGGGNLCNPPVCKYNNKEYRAGETFPDVNNCDQCTCAADGNVACTDRACPDVTCKYNGKTFAIGQQYPDVDCCNMCTCQADGTSACGGRLCGPRGGNLCTPAAD